MVSASAGSRCCISISHQANHTIGLIKECSSAQNCLGTTKLFTASKLAVTYRLALLADPPLQHSFPFCSPLPQPPSFISSYLSFSTHRLDSPLPPFSSCRALCNGRILKLYLMRVLSGSRPFVHVLLSEGDSWRSRRKNVCPCATTSVSFLFDRTFITPLLFSALHLEILLRQRSSSGRGTQKVSSTT